MIVGCLGNVVFQVSEDTVKTINNMQWTGSARYTTHHRHNGNALTEFTGIDPDKITFDIHLSAYLGISPMAEIKELWTYIRSGAAVPFVLGNQGYGRYRWNVVSQKIKMQTYDGRGNVTTATVSVTLQEYLRS